MSKCIKCLNPIDADEFVVNKYMSYCPDCARMLHLGESKEGKPLSDYHVLGRKPPEELTAISEPGGKADAP